MQTAVLEYHQIFPPAQSFLIMEPAALLDQSTTYLVVHFEVFYLTTTQIDSLDSSVDRNSITVSFLKYFAAVGPVYSLSSNRVLCHLNFGVK